MKIIYIIGLLVLCCCSNVRAIDTDSNSLERAFSATGLITLSNVNYTVSVVTNQNPITEKRAKTRDKTYDALIFSIFALLLSVVTLIYTICRSPE